MARVTQKEKVQFLALWHQSLNDFPTFCTLIKIQKKKKDEEGSFLHFTPENWYHAQREFERARTGFDIVLKARRQGISSLECARNVWFALKKPGAQVVLLAQDKATKDELYGVMRAILDYLYGLQDNLGISFMPARTKDNTEGIQFENGSKITPLQSKQDKIKAERTGQGLTIDRLHCTEVSRYAFPDETMKALLIAAEGATEIVLESTANGARGWFYEMFKSAETHTHPRFTAHFFPWYTHHEYRSKPQVSEYDYSPKDDTEEYLVSIGIDKEQLVWWRNTVSELKDSALEQYPVDSTSCFKSSGGNWIPLSHVAFYEAKVEPAPLLERVPKYALNLRIWRMPQPGLRYFIGADASEGVGLDASSLYVIESHSGQMCAMLRDANLPPHHFASVLNWAGHLYNDAMIGIERNGSAGGRALHCLLHDEHYPQVFGHAKFANTGTPYGWNTDAETRPRLYGLIQQSIHERSAHIPDIWLLNELKTIVVEKGKPQAAKGCNDDCVIAWGIALGMREEIPAPSGTLFISAGKTSTHHFLRGYSNGSNRFSY